MADVAKPPAPNFFDQQASATYDERNRKLAPIADGMHFLMRLVLNDLPERARVLCVGVGTGAEILSLAREFPRWEFVGQDPSEPMLEVCRRRLEEAGIADRCTLVPGYVQDLPPGGDYDAVSSVLVAHFVPREARAGFFSAMTAQLRPGGTLVNAEISFDLDSPESSSMTEQWAKVQRLMGATPESLAALPKVLREVLTVLPPAETERLLRDSGIAMPVPFFQSFMIRAWYGTTLRR
jgi:tRNA (cmo5U34)-methyltransferase